ncbi:hypothetical protein Y032_0008g167 [Ancylostoma ceylanicum]|uniref:7TM GPCR serpentine receptor class x (Srx) domain-containing protein n=1 Tax=Ancylostoma ceylanicum TaxID=53326 RepID=A0A016VK00_9BILA|nr:hypothetical protein Y032_0008g167 [Ancylostoma ceylanicum]
MVVCEIAFFVYWEFSGVEYYGPLEVIMSETVELLFFDVLILPYLILNGFVSRIIAANRRYTVGNSSLRLHKAFSAQQEDLFL